LSGSRRSPLCAAIQNPDSGGIRGRAVDFAIRPSPGLTASGEIGVAGQT
jgi:hypothetical protein